jgi:hypothetical protein
MVTKLHSAPLRICLVAAICLMVLVAAFQAFWLLMGSLALDRGPIPRVYWLNVVRFFCFLVSAVTLWKWPWIAISVAWVDLFLILSGFSPWEDHSATTFFFQFMFDHIFFIAANAGFVAAVLLRRSRLANPA